MPTVRLSDRALIAVSGADAEHFLQNLITTDLDALEPGTVKPGALLTPQGKILFDFLVSRDGQGGLQLECRADIVDDLLRRLTMYRLRAKVDFQTTSPAPVAVFWDTYRDRSDPEDALLDWRFGTPNVFRRYHDVPLTSEWINSWHLHRILEGVPESGSDYALGEAFPHDVHLDQNDGVGFKKGCYVGQEVVSRMQHRGTARRRFLIADADQDLPPAGTPVTVNGRAIGTLGTVWEDSGLALVRIDKVADAMRQGIPILAGDVVIRLEIPEMARFTFPEASSTPDEA